MNPWMALLLFAASAQAQVSEKVAFEARPFRLDQVRLLPGPFRDAQERDRGFLLEQDADRLLHTFRLTAHLPSQAEPLGGWEAPRGELRGHTMGHYLSACALMYAATGDAKLKQRIDYLVAELAKCQAALPACGYRPGFLSAYPESFFDRVDACQPVWAPYYTLHKIMAGLLDAYELAANKQALDVLVKLADWLDGRIARVSDQQQQKVLGNEHGGINEALANLAGATGQQRYLALARRFNHDAIFAPLARGEDQLDGKHANTQIPKIIGAARQYELTGEPMFADVARNFWKYVALDRAYCIGGHSDQEHFFPVAQFSRHLSPATAETCNTYNMLKLTRHLFQWEPAARTMDFYERALLNQILASQDPRTGMTFYFAALRPGHFKSYCTPTNSYWCCTGTGMENHAKYADTIYFHAPDTLYVNLFVASQLDWPEKGVTLRQETAFPERDATRLVVRCKLPVRFVMKIRHPFWAESAAVSINGAAADMRSSPGSYLGLERTWHDGDVVEMRLPMRLHVEALPDNPRVAAILYGPTVLAGELGTAGMEKLNLYTKGQLDLAHTPSPEVPVLMCEPAELVKHLEPVDGQAATFRTRGIGRPRDVTLSPYYRLHHQRFNVYWQLLTEADWTARQAELARAAAQRKAFEARIVDEVRPGEQQPETDHHLQGEQSNQGEYANRRWRDARHPGWFNYTVKVLPDQPVVLRCDYWGSDAGRTFDILVDAQKIAQQKLERNRPGEFMSVEYPIPAALTRGKTSVTVRFQSVQGRAGGLFGLTILRPGQP